MDTLRILSLNCYVIGTIKLTPTLKSSVLLELQLLQYLFCLIYLIELSVCHFRPVVFSISGDVTFEANLVLATLASDVAAASQSATSSQLVTPGGLSNSQAYCNVRQTTATLKRPTHGANDPTSARYVVGLSTVL
jgi:hypothetical protein